MRGVTEAELTAENGPAEPDRSSEPVVNNPCFSGSRSGEKTFGKGPILGLIGIKAITLVLVALLAIGASALLRSSALGGFMLDVLRR